MKRAPTTFVRLFLFAALSVTVWSQEPSYAAVTATDKGSLQTDVNGNTKVNRGDTIRHTVTINSSGGDASGVSLSETIDVNTTLAGAVSASPVAIDDTFPVTVVGNVAIDSAALATPFSVTANDFPGLNPAAAISVYDATTAQGGQIVMTTSGPDMGKFTYNPPAGFEGTDTFTYTLGDSAVVTSTSANRTATVSITVSGMIWFVNNSAGACTANCDGRLSSPFTTLAALNAVNNGNGLNPATGDNIFIHYSGTDYSGPITLLNNQKLIGQGATASLQAITGLSPQATVTAFPVTGGANPTISGNGVVLTSNNTLRGFTIGNSTSTALSGTNFGTLTLNEVVVNTTGAGLSLNNGTSTATFTSFTSTGGANNISLTDVGGTIDFGSGGALSGASGTSFAVSSGTAAISYGGTISKSSVGRIADIQSRSGGNITLSGNLTCTAPCSGINLTSNTGGSTTFSGSTKTITTGTATAVALGTNTGHTINFTNGGLAIATTSGNGLNVTGGGTVSITGVNNTITTTTGIALNFQNTTIGASGLTFKSISAGSSGNPANGIVLINTGSSGGLTVTGDGTNTSVGGNASGGTIQNCSGADGALAGSGIYLDRTSNVVLRRMTITGTNQNFGIRGLSVNNFTLEYSTVSGTNGTAASLTYPENYGEGSIFFGNATTNGLTGTGVFTNNSVSGGRARNLSIVNGGVASATLLTVKGSTFGAMQNLSSGNQSFAVEPRTSGSTVNVVFGGTNAGEGNTLTNAVSDLANFTGQTGTNMDVQFKNNTLSNNNTSNIIGGGSLVLASQGVMTFNASGNTMRDANGSAVTFFKGSTGTSLSGIFTNNTIGVSGVTDSGSKTGNGISVSAAGAGTMGFTITNNQIHQIHGNSHIWADNTGGSYTANFTITGNILDTPGGGWFAGIAMTNGAPSSSDTVNVCANIKTNNFNLGGNLGVIVGVSGAGSGHTLNLPGYAGGANLTNVQNFIQGTNSGSFTTSAYNDSPATAAAFTGSGTSCPTP